MRSQPTALEVDVNAYVSSGGCEADGEMPPGQGSASMQCRTPSPPIEADSAHAALDAAPGLIDVEDVPRSGDLVGGVTPHDEDVGGAPDEERPATAPAPIDSAAPLVPATMASEKLRPAWASMSIS